MIRRWIYGFLALLVGSLQLAAQSQVVLNPGFEQTAKFNGKPAYWRVGFSGSSAYYSDSLGQWDLDKNYFTEGKQSLRLNPADSSSYAFSQILHVPSFNLQGQKVRLSVDIRHQNLAEPPVVFLAAINPELPADPLLGFGTAGKAIIQAYPDSNAFTTYADSFTASSKAAYMQLAISAKGEAGKAWFDDVQVRMQGHNPGPPPQNVASPLDDERSFPTAFTTESPIDRSKRAMEKAVDTTARYSEAINLFAHVRWSAITGEPITHGHERMLAFDRLAEQQNLDKILTFDFTHGGPGNVGYLNPKPNGDTVGNLNNPAVQQALLNEALKLTDTINPDYLVFGIEMNQFYDRNPSQWGAFTKLMQTLADSVKSRDSSIHLTTYTNLKWLVNKDGALKTDHADVWRQLLPAIESIGYSAYPGNRFYPALDSIPEGYYTRPQAVAPELPLFLNEFGVPGGDSTSITEQRQAKELGRMLAELNQTETEMASFYALFDQQYLGTPSWFKKAFSAIGLYYEDGTPKAAKATWEAIFTDTGKSSSLAGPTGTQQGLTIYPNPVTDEQAYVSFNLTHSNKVKLTLFNLEGYQCYARPEQDLAAGKHRFPIPISDLKAGIYLVQLKTGMKARCGRLVITH